MAKVNIIINNGEIISIEKDTFIDISNKYIDFFKNMIEGIDYEDIGKEDIPLNSEEASYENVSIIIKFLCTIRQTHELKKESVEEKIFAISKINILEEEFIKNLSTESIFKLILIANYLGCEYVLNLLCKSVAKKIKECPDDEAIKREFAIPREYT